MRMYSVDTFADHLYYVIAENIDEACSQVNPTENILVTDISEFANNEDIIDIIIDEGFDEEVTKDLLKEYLS